MQSTTIFLLSQLIGLAPMLIVYLGGMVLAAVWWGRGPRAAGLAMAGLAICVIGMLGTTLVHTWLIGNRGTATMTNIAQVMGWVAMAGSVAHAGGIALVIAAVFAGRPRPAGGGFEVVGGMRDER